MSDPRLFRLRVTYRLSDRLALLSHLEVTRALERNVRRAKLPFSVTNGFSPHMKISFGGALPVGVGGEKEIYDVFLNQYIAPAKALKALQDSAALDIHPTDCVYIENNAPAASVAYPVGIYSARLSRPIDITVPETIDVTRKKKTKTLKTDDYLRGSVDVDGDEVVFRLEALATGSLRPDAFINACIKRSAAENGDEDDALGIDVLSMTRIDQMTSYNISDR